MAAIKGEFEIGEEWTEDPKAKEQSHTFLGRDIKVIRSNGERYFEVTQTNYALQLQEMVISAGANLETRLEEREHSMFRACVGRINWL